MTVEELKEIMKAFSESDISYMKYKQEGNEVLTLEKKKETVVEQVSPCVTVLPEKKPEAGVQEAKKEEVQGTIVKSPLVGTFYSSPSPDAQPFVSVGDHVKKGQVLGIIEAMKLMNDIECEADGEIAEILVENQAMVEYDQPLFRIV